MAQWTILHVKNNTAPKLQFVRHNYITPIITSEAGVIQSHRSFLEWTGVIT